VSEVWRRSLFTKTKDVVRSCYEIVDLKLLRWLTNAMLWVFYGSIVIHMRRTFRPMFRER
jgi:hypothetical protein